MGEINKVFKRSFPRNSYRMNANAAGTPMAVEKTAVSDPNTIEFLKASKMAECQNNDGYNRGKHPKIHQKCISFDE